MLLIPSTHHAHPGGLAALGIAWLTRGHEVGLIVVAAVTVEMIDAEAVVEELAIPFEGHPTPVTRLGSPPSRGKRDGSVLPYPSLAVAQRMVWVLEDIPAVPDSPVHAHFCPLVPDVDQVGPSPFTVEMRRPRQDLGSATLGTS